MEISEETRELVDVTIRVRETPGSCSDWIARGAKT